ncbi:MAG: hypothetical protein ACXAEN_22975 [Candidatus Thorarchaeota archaeon]
MGSISKVKKVPKQPYESFVGYGEFSNVMETGETITLGSSAVTAIDKEGEDASSDLLSGSAAVYNDDDGNPWRLGIRIVDGTVLLSPYKVTFKIITSLANKWEVDMYVEVIET